AISTSARRMDELLRDLLDFTRISRCELELRGVDLGNILKKLSLNSSGIVPGAFVTIAEPLPVVLGHDVALEQVFTNLVGNAQKFVRREVPPAIRVYAEIRDRRARVYVEDNGIGIAPEHRERIFRVFERLHSQQEFPGTGVGLAIVKTYVEKMNGRVG